MRIEKEQSYRTYNKIRRYKILKSAENIIFDYLSSITPSEEVNIKLLNGINIKRKYIKKKKYSKGMFQNIECPEHVNVKACLSKYYNGQVNQYLFENTVLLHTITSS